MTAERTFRLDRDTVRDGPTLIGGSPLRLFRLTEAGNDVVDRLALGEPMAESGLVSRLLDAGAVHPVAGPPQRFGIDDVTTVVPTLDTPVDPPGGAIVVDDGSQPPVAGATIRLATNRGPAAARNAGLAAVRTPLVAFVDADATVPDGWFEPLLGHFDDDRVALVAPRVVTPDGPGAIERYEHRHGPLDLGPEPARVRAGTRVSYVPAAAVVARVDALRALEGFDESLRFGEDVDLVWRLDDAGWRVRYEPAVVAHHDARSSWAAWFRQRVTYGSSAAPLAKRHRGRLAPARMSGWSVSTWAAAVAAHPVAGAAISAATGAALVRKLPDVTPRRSFSLAWRGNQHAGASLAQAVRRAWWPVLAVAAIRSRLARRVLVASFVAAGSPLRAVDDVAYSIGVWRGMATERTIDPIVPEITSWPGSSASPPAAPPRPGDAR